MDRLVDELRVLVPNGEQLEFTAPSPQTLAAPDQGVENDLTHALQWFFHFACSSPGALGMWQRRLCEARAARWRRTGDAARPIGCRRQAQCERMAAAYERLATPTALLRALKPCYGLFAETHAEMLHRRGAAQTALQVTVAAPPALGWLQAAAAGQHLDLQCCAAQYVEWVGAMFPDARVREVASVSLHSSAPVAPGPDALPARALTVALLAAGGGFVLGREWADDAAIAAVLAAAQPAALATDLLRRAGFGPDPQDSPWASVGAPSMSARHSLALLTPEGLRRVPAADRSYYSAPSTAVALGGAPAAALVLEVRRDAVSGQVTSGDVYLGVLEPVRFPGADAPQAALVMARFRPPAAGAPPLPRVSEWRRLLADGYAWRLLLAHQQARAADATVPSLDALCAGGDAHHALQASLYAAVRAQGTDRSPHPCEAEDALTRAAAPKTESPASAKRSRRTRGGATGVGAAPKRRKPSLASPPPAPAPPLPPPAPPRGSSDAGARLARACAYHLMTAAKHRGSATDPHERCTPLIDQIATHLSLCHD